MTRKVNLALIHNATEVTPQGQYWRHLHDIELVRRGVLDKVRAPKEGTPEVYTLNEIAIPFGEQWQYALAAWNPLMSIQHIAALMDTRRAFFNLKGVPGRADFLQREFLDKPDPAMSKSYICGGGLLSGVVEGNMLRVNVMDGNFKPPLKEGRGYPSRLDEVRWGDYLYNPRDNPDKFIVAVNVGEAGGVFPLTSRGGLYNWTPDRRPYAFLPLVARREVLYPLDRLERVDVWMSPYEIRL